MTPHSLAMVEEVFQYLLAGGILAGVWKASAILADIRGMLKAGASWMQENKPIIDKSHEAVKAHQRGGYELAKRVEKLDFISAPPEFQSPHL